MVALQKEVSPYCPVWLTSIAVSRSYPIRTGTSTQAPRVNVGVRLVQRTTRHQPGGFRIKTSILSGNCDHPHSRSYRASHLEGKVGATRSVLHRARHRVGRTSGSIARVRGVRSGYITAGGAENVGPPGRNVSFGTAPPAWARRYPFAIQSQSSRL
jgi:hypothetical protein